MRGEETDGPALRVDAPARRARRDIRWKRDSAVYVDHDRYMSGEVELRPMLRQVLRERGARMQRAIRENAHALQYGLGDEDGEDAVHRLLAALQSRAAFIDERL